MTRQICRACFNETVVISDQCETRHEEEPQFNLKDQNAGAERDQWPRHLMARVVLGPPDQKKYIYIYNNLKFYIYLPLKNFGTTLNFFYQSN